MFQEQEPMITENHLPYLVPRDILQQRIRTFQDVMQREGIRLAWIDHLADRLYYSGSAQNGVLLIPSHEAPVFFVKKSLSRAAGEAGVDVEPYPGRKALLKRISQWLDGGVLALAMDATPAAVYAWLKSLDTEIRDAAFFIRMQRAVKDAWELEQIRRAAHQAVVLMQELPDLVRPSMTEWSLSIQIESRMRELGHSGTIRVRNRASDPGMLNLVSGDSALYPTSFDGCVGGEGLFPFSSAAAGRRELRAGETLMVDAVTGWNGYFADTTRSFALGTVKEEALAAHDFCKEVLSDLESLMKPGADLSEIFETAQKNAESRGLPPGFMGHGENRVRFFGHGIGLELDEYPVIASGMPMRLAPDMVLAVEPKAFIAGVGAVGLENTYRITESGVENLTPAGDALKSISF